MYVCIQVFNYTGWDHFVLYTFCIVLIYTSQPKCYEVVLYTDDVQLLYQIYFYMTSVPINQTNMYILFSLNTDDINFANKTLSLCMYDTFSFKPSNCMYVMYVMYVCTVCNDQPAFGECSQWS